MLLARTLEDFVEFVSMNDFRILHYKEYDHKAL